ncbi:MAG: nitroreductase [Clostridia bacterium]|nr:nitroreductase [Clostridia bacterium]
MTLYEAILARRSVRTFSGGMLSREEADALMNYAKNVKNPYGLTVNWHFLPAGGKISSPVIVGEPAYITGTVPRTVHAEEAFGYAFEEVLLYALTLGIGSVWIAGTMDRAAFETAVGLTGGELMPCVSPVGKFAEKMSLRESVMRKGVGADNRKPAHELFFDGSFDKPLAVVGTHWLYDALEAVRRAPSAVNRQPWRVIVTPTHAHFYEKKTAGYERNGMDLQKIDLGIALCHFDLAAKDRGVSLTFGITDPGIPHPSDVFYVASYKFV